ncbi:sodium:solute symporter [Chitinimonas sp. BJYL2]|uniref:sodium:solute symporter n=1 Tax=Chitinimonas sp. BJYL2 TaxID=2976696 RepID=UPI0022B3DCCA|nr:sodium:solute symporter [Chitinimonas sp. BJYL2]
MSPALLAAFVVAYFLILLFAAWLTSRKAGNEDFFIGGRKSHWMLVAFGMIGTSLSGVTFISVPGAVGMDGFAYFQIILGHLIGYLVVAGVLLPLYYRLNLTSIYDYLGQRLGPGAYRTGASFFILSRTLGATARLYLVVNILQATILDRLGVPFAATASLMLVMILLYTYEGGVKTIVWTDTLQTSCMLLGLIICAWFLMDRLNLDVSSSLDAMRSEGLSRLFVWDPDSRLFIVKQIVAGIFITIAMTGLDQEMMQKNISVRTLRDSQKNMLVLAVVFAGVVLLFLFLGGLLHLFARQNGMTETGDALFPAVVLGHLPELVQVIFVIALISALFPSADGAITALTASFCIDLLGMQKRDDWSSEHKKRIRQRVHLTFGAVFLLLVLGFKAINNPSMIGLILKLAAYTYGPLLGLFAFGILTRRSVRDGAVIWIALAAPLLCYVLNANQHHLFGSYQLGLELLLLNGALTFAGLWSVSRPAEAGALAKA